jgi:hypothetical protein
MLDEMPLLTIGLSTLFGTAGGCISYDFSNWDKVNEFKARYYEAIGENVAKEWGLSVLEGATIGAVIGISAVAAYKAYKPIRGKS